MISFFKSGWCISKIRATQHITRMSFLTDNGLLEFHGDIALASFIFCPAWACGFTCAIVYPGITFVLFLELCSGTCGRPHEVIGRGKCSVRQMQVVLLGNVLRGVFVSAPCSSSAVPTDEIANLLRPLDRPGWQELRDIELKELHNFIRLLQPDR